MSARQLQTAVRFNQTLNAFSSLTPELVQNLPSQSSVLVMAPHCDDESLGCGGTLYKHHLAGNFITALFMTDGSQSISNEKPSDLVNIRKVEAKKAANVLGIDKCVFLDYPDQQLRKNKETVEKVIAVLKENRPDSVYIPFYLDNHPDHMETASICLEALRHHPVKNAFFYEIWTTLIPNLLVDITSALEKKLEAITVYRSQKNIASLAAQTKSLNRYRSIHSNDQCKYAEAFLKFNSNDLSKFTM